MQRCWLPSLADTDLLPDGHTGIKIVILYAQIIDI